MSSKSEGIDTIRGSVVVTAFLGGICGRGGNLGLGRGGRGGGLIMTESGEANTSAPRLRWSYIAVTIDTGGVRELDGVNYLI